MPLVPMPELMRAALVGGYGLGYFEAWDGYSLEAVCEAAELERSPVILGFGGMMADRRWLDEGGVEALGALGRVRAERLTVPCALILNEAQTLDQALRGIDAGFNAVMVDTSAWPYDEAVVAVSALVQAAHSRGVAVEAELGRLPDATSDGIDDTGSTLTDPDQAAAFVAATGVDCLAVSIGNVHLLTAHSATIDMNRLKAIHTRVSVPLVIHGGTSFPPELVAEAVRHGAGKFNVGTILKRRFLSGAHAALNELTEPIDVHEALGSHKAGDFLVSGKTAMREKVRELMRGYGSSDQV